MSIQTPAEWAEHLRTVATPGALAEVPLGLGEMELAFRHAVIGRETGAEEAAHQDLHGDALLWAAVTNPNVDIDRCVDLDADGALFDQGLFRAIEVWTESELSGLHALWWIARTRADSRLSGRMERARDWHLMVTQPDNATNRPWALHAFVLADTFEGRHYAETLLHNCMSMSGVPDALSSWVLLDCARALEASQTDQ